MVHYVCSICGHIYEEDKGEPECRVPPGTSFSELPEEYRCPVCGAAAALFRVG